MHTHTHTHTHTCEVEEEVLVIGDEGNIEGLPQIPVEPEAQHQKNKNAFRPLTGSSVEPAAQAAVAHYARRPLCMRFEAVAPAVCTRSLHPQSATRVAHERDVALGTCAAQDGLSAYFQAP